VRWLAGAGAVALASLAAPACGNQSDAGPVEIRVATDASGPVEAETTECRYDGDRQVTASGVVRNPGENVYYVSIEVRFVDGDGIRVDIGSDSISDLQPGEAAHWDTSVYSDQADTVVACEVNAEAS